MAQEENKNTRLVELRNRLQDVDAKLLHLAEQDRLLTEEEEVRWEDLTTERETIVPEFEKLEERSKRAADIRSKTYRQISGLPDAKKPTDEFFGVDVRTMDWRSARDGALRILEDRDQNHMLSTHQGDLLDNHVRSAGYTELARRILVTENEHYRSA